MILETQEKLKTTMPAKRYEHTLGVMYTASALAMVHNVDIDTAMIAGLLHDCAKCISLDQMLQLSEQYALELSQDELNNPSLIHAKLGAVLAEKEYGVKDMDIISAISFHTTGRPDMSKLEQIIYLADYIEPHRKTPNLDDLRLLCFDNLALAMEECSKRTIDFLESNNQYIAPTSRDTYAYYSNLNK